MLFFESKILTNIHAIEVMGNRKISVQYFLHTHLDDTYSSASIVRTNQKRMLFAFGFKPRPDFIRFFSWLFVVNKVEATPIARFAACVAFFYYSRTEKP